MVHSPHDERLVAVVTGGERARSRVHGPGKDLAAIHGADGSGHVPCSLETAVGWLL